VVYLNRLTLVRYCRNITSNWLLILRTSTSSCYATATQGWGTVYAIYNILTIYCNICNIPIYCSLKQTLQYIWCVRGEYCNIYGLARERLPYIDHIRFPIPESKYYTPVYSLPTASFPIIDHQNVFLSAIYHWSQHLMCLRRDKSSCWIEEAPTPTYY